MTVSGADSIELEGSEHPEASIYSVKVKRIIIKTIRSRQRPESHLRLQTPLDHSLFHQCPPRREGDE